MFMLLKVAFANEWKYNFWKKKFTRCAKTISTVLVMTSYWLGKSYSGWQYVVSYKNEFKGIIQTSVNIIHRKPFLATTIQRTCNVLEDSRLAKKLLQPDALLKNFLLHYKVIFLLSNQLNDKDLMQCTGYLQGRLE